MTLRPAQLAGHPAAGAELEQHRLAARFPDRDLFDHQRRKTLGLDQQRVLGRGQTLKLEQPAAIAFGDDPSGKFLAPAEERLRFAEGFDPRSGNRCVSGGDHHSGDGIGPGLSGPHRETSSQQRQHRANPKPDCRSAHGDEVSLYPLRYPFQ
ncbi:MAG TPA: hypothetical protein VGB99_02655 [Acidobacteriota bacterium]